MERIIVDSEGKPRFAVEVTEEISPLRGVNDAAASTARAIAEVGDVIAESSREILGAIKEGLGDLAPDEMELQFGVSMSADVGLPMIVKTSGEANFMVRVCWKPRS